MLCNRELKRTISTYLDNEMASEERHAFDSENGQQPLRSALNRAIWGSFQANGIKVPTPQREVRMVGGPPPADVPTSR